MDWKKAEKIEGGSIKIPDGWLHLHYYEALNVLFRVENALRILVYVFLKETKKDKWADVQITSDDGGDTTVAAIAKKRLAQDGKFGYLGHRLASPLMRLTSGELTRVILADAYWPVFSAFFPASKDLVRTKLEEIGNIRNSLAHFRPIKEDDVEVVKQNANQVLSRVEEEIENLLGVPQTTPVPTNTADEWFADLKLVAGQYCKLGFMQSKNERWIRLRLTFSASAVLVHGSKSSKHWHVPTLNSSSILRCSPALLEHVIFASEELSWIDDRKKEPAEPFEKYVDLTFSRATLSSAHQVIKSDLQQVLVSIATETDLIREDNLARGQLVRFASVFAHLGREGTWSVRKDDMKSPLKDDDPAEYWGEQPIVFSDFVSNTDSYPWMPVHISPPTF